jgi:hypothetical protein
MLVGAYGVPLTQSEKIGNANRINEILGSDQWGHDDAESTRVDRLPDQALVYGRQLVERPGGARTPRGWPEPNDEVPT